MKKKTLIYTLIALVVLAASFVWLSSRTSDKVEPARIITAENGGVTGADVEIADPETAIVEESADDSISPETAESSSASAPTPRSGLVATDPEVVKLGSGEIQLVEFFAFW